MESFPPVPMPDEGYSEHPLNPTGAEGELARILSDSDSSWIIQRTAGLTPAQRAQLAISIIRGLPSGQKTQLVSSALQELSTTIIAGIVHEQLNPRLYINFVEALPVEICLNIFSYLDPVSLIHVSMCCSSWYELAVDRKLWERLYIMEGWHLVPSQIQAAERRMNKLLLTSSPPLSHTGTSTPTPRRLTMTDDSHAHKKRAILAEPDQESGYDTMEVDREGDERDDSVDVEMTVPSLLGGPSHLISANTSSSKSSSTMNSPFGRLAMGSLSPSPGTRSSIDRKGKGKEVALVTDTRSSSPGRPRRPGSTLWTLDPVDRIYKLNYRHLYSLRRRLEYNWEAGRFQNFQLPQPDFPHEGHKECIYSLQFDSEYLVSGSRDKTLRIWSLDTRRLARPPLLGHSGSVLCLQFDSSPEEDLIASGSSDSNVILWKFSTGRQIQVLTSAHRESVLNVKFDKRILVTCSKDKMIRIFNRRSLKAGDPGYGQVDPVPASVPMYHESPLDLMPVKPPYTEIGRLEGHSAAVNAVQICGDEIVSASGDRHIKVWNWPTQTCIRTMPAHNKGIACVQYDGRRIVSGSSDNEVKVFDRETGLEVASLRAHAALVRTVQAGFGDLPNSAEDDAMQARKVDEEYLKALKARTVKNPYGHRGRLHNAGSRRPDNITTFGAKLPPGGGGGQYGRIVSGSYDQTIIIWRRDREGVWRNAHTLRQEAAAASAAQKRTPSQTPAPVPPRAQSSRALPSLAIASSTVAFQQALESAQSEDLLPGSMTTQEAFQYYRVIDQVSAHPPLLDRALRRYPNMMLFSDQIEEAINRVDSPELRLELGAVLAEAMLRSRNSSRSREAASADSPANGEASSSLAANVASSSSTPTPILAAPHPRGPSRLLNPTSLSARASSSHQDPNEATVHAASRSSSMPLPAGVDQAITPLQPQTQARPQIPTTPAHPPPAPQPALANTAVATGAATAAHHPHMAGESNPARVFKLQFDARMIICCSQSWTIVGWDFCHGDPELEEASKFFGTVS